MWPSNADVVKLFLALATQWRWLMVPTTAGPVPTMLGLDYAAADTTARLMGRPLAPAGFADLQIMEAAALAAARR